MTKSMHKLSRNWVVASFVRHRRSTLSSFPRRRESTPRTFQSERLTYWNPAFAGMTSGLAWLNRANHATTHNWAPRCDGNLFSDPISGVRVVYALWPLTHHGIAQSLSHLESRDGHALFGAKLAQM
jgi:hypothetical protein